MNGTFTCENCGKTHEKGWSDEEAAAEAQELFPGIDISDPAEAGVVCDDCFKRIMGRVQAEAPELIGAAWRDGPQPIPDFPGFVEHLVTGKGYGRNPCSAHCPDRESEHAHLRTPDGQDFITWADGRYSGYDLTQPAKLIYPAAQVGNAIGEIRTSRCYQMSNGSMVHVKPGCRCPR